jgi:hypothetical protein
VGGCIYPSGVFPEIKNISAAGGLYSHEHDGHDLGNCDSFNGASINEAFPNAND